ncbi:MAG: tripartite tricarboxylate transporter substrate binding protein, partial [Pseudolabrys sp.]
MLSFPIIALAAAVLLLSPSVSSAQAWPSQPVTLMVPFPAGGTADLLARGTAQALSDAFGQPFVVENRAGASGNLAAGAVARAAPDGSSLLFASQAQAAFNRFMFKSLPYDPSRDLVPVVLVIKSPVALVAGVDAPVNSFQSMIDYAKANPGKLSIGQAGIGSMAHVAYELLQQKAGIKLNGVPYKGGAPMVTDLLGGHLPLASDLLSNFIQLAKEKRVTLLALATPQRLSDLPNVPTVQELIHAPFEA